MAEYHRSAIDGNAAAEDAGSGAGGGRAPVVAASGPDPVRAGPLALRSLCVRDRASADHSRGSGGSPEQSLLATCTHDRPSLGKTFLPVCGTSGNSDALSCRPEIDAPSDSAAPVGRLESIDALSAELRVCVRDMLAILLGDVLKVLLLRQAAAAKSAAAAATAASAAASPDGARPRGDRWESDRFCDVSVARSSRR